jgi:hypothetical protein
MILRKKNAQTFYCQVCDLTTSNKCDWKRHLSTTKHKNANNANMMLTKKTPNHCQSCGRVFKHRSSLSRHKKKCAPPCPEVKKINNTNEETLVDVEKESLKEEVKELKATMREIINVQVETTRRFQETIQDMVPRIGNTVNNRMSINVFLNEKCKDAMNLTDFIGKLSVSLEDLAYTKDHGYVKGMKNIVVKQLQDMSPTERPIHCTDQKRLQFYVKDDNEWAKDMSHQKIDRTIEDAKLKQIGRIREWESKHPDYLRDDTLLKEWNTMVRNVMGGVEDKERTKNMDSIKKGLGATLEMKKELITK